MNFRFRISVFALLTLAIAAGAQQRRDYNFTLQTDPYLTSANPAVIDRFSGDRLATAELTFAKNDGLVCSLTESSNSLAAGALTEAFVKVSDRVAFYGKLSYNYFNGKGMGGQVLMDPEYNPVNFLESTDTTVGTKVRELYNVAGGMTFKFSDRLSAGVKIDYTSGDQSKLKDPRFINYWMDLDISAGVNWSVSSVWNLGLALRYCNTLETVKGHIYGTTDKQYFIDIDKGGYWGITEQLAGDLAYLPESSSRPMANDWFGASMQFNYLGKLKLFNELAFDRRTGYYGDRASGKPLFFEFSGFAASYAGSLLIPSGKNIHKLTLNAKYSPLTNSENSFRYDTPTGKETVVVYTGQSEILERGDVTAELSYSWFGNTEGYRPATVLGFTADAFYRDQTTTFYPSYRNHNYCRYSLAANAGKSFFSSGNIFTLALDAVFRSGFGTPKDDGSFAGGTTKLKSFDFWLSRQFEYDTASRIGAGLSFTYTRVFKERLAAFVTLKDDFTSLIQEPQYLKGRTRNALLLTLGCNF